MKEERVCFENKGQKIVGILHKPDSINSPAIIMCHGFSGNKNEEHDMFVHAAKKFCESDFTVLRFDFRGLGESEGDFVDMTISEEVSDLKKAIDFISEQGYNNIGVLGLSLGASVSVLGWNKKIKTLVLWSPANPNEKTFIKAFGKETFKEIEEKGFSDLKFNKNGWRTQTSFKVGRKFLEDVKKTNIINSIKSVKCSILVIQGTEDEVLDPKDSEEIYIKANKPKEIKLIENANHTFDNPEHENKVIQLSLNWFKKWLT